MTSKPLLSVCVPSRNRQYYFQHTIRAELQSPHRNVEFIFADNSDEPAIMNDFIKSIDDPRMVYLPSEDRVLSMVDNWERCMEACSGDWIVFIGDDDYMDTDLVLLLDRLMAVEPDTDALHWPPVNYNWPTEEGKIHGTKIVLKEEIFLLHKSLLENSMFGWKDASHVPHSGFSIYHSAISRKLMLRIKETFGGLYFEHPIVDYDNSCKVIALGQKFAVCPRPFSVMGKCPLSNSAGIGKRDEYRRNISALIGEVGRDFETDDAVRDLPFKSLLGTPAVIAQMQHWFKTKYGYEYPNWEVGFAKACAIDTGYYADQESFDQAREAYAQAFASWKGGKYLRHYNPKFIGKRDAANSIKTGFFENAVLIEETIGGSRTVGEFFDIVRCMIKPADMLEINPEGLRAGRPAPQTLRLNAPLSERRRAS
ncbi:glycosyltransferase family 2 protein [Rhizobium halophytocola]|uniref:Glycosyltransferase involved in cell wall biosynthesis n=1 Tax=Rhizobium halophytocola TaxID=735519 RepID=A0ABS4E0Q2_9HYPH|nr:glycosyltransferase family A protein [Rhizobium halophytocola]MBP1851510.1 glycosyltransferase involved in cell wall biosynthesis [Rhizobium halophytocola]